MPPRPSLTRYILFAGVPLAIWTVWRAYVVIHADAGARRFQIVSTVSALAVGVGLVLFGYFRPGQRFPRIILVAIALLLIIIAVLFRQHTPQ